MARILPPRSRRICPRRPGRTDRPGRRPRPDLRHAVLAVTTLVVVALAAALTPRALSAQSRSFSLAVPESLAGTGVIRYLLPRFSLKHGVRANVVPPGAPADAEITAEPQPGAIAVFTADGVSHYLLLRSDNPHATTFADWLTSDIGRRTIERYAGKDVALGLPVQERTVTERPLTGDASRGLALARSRCGRCHVVDTENRLRGIGSTPAFTTLRALPDWRERFETFYVRNPHPAYTRVTGLSDEFAIDRPPPIHLLELDLDDLDDIIAYVATLEPADLGAPIRSQ